jgi:tetratricopeptide (TPR) repeat protein
MFDDKADLQLKSLENLEFAAEQFQQLLELDTAFFNFGLVKSEPGNSQHKHICYKRLVRSYTNMAKLVSTSDDAKRKEIHDKGLVFFKKLEDYQRTYREVVSANLRMAEFLLQLKYYEDAETKFMFVAPEDMIEEDNEMKTTMLNNHELQALKGLTKCYCESGKIELARSLVQRVKDRLEVNNEDKELEYFKKMLLDLKLSE